MAFGGPELSLDLLAEDRILTTACFGTNTETSKVAGLAEGHETTVDVSHDTIALPG